MTEATKTSRQSSEGQTKKTKTAPKADLISFAVIETGGKQYKVKLGKEIKIEKLPKAEEGKKISFDKVLLIDDGKTTNIGDPYLKNVKVEGEIIQIGRDKKVNVVKYKAKTRYHKKTGHRQHFLKVRISKI
jgi:large subunit ribosomal protein L21